MKRVKRGIIMFYDMMIKKHSWYKLKQAYNAVVCFTFKLSSLRENFQCGGGQPYIISTAADASCCCKGNSFLVSYLNSHKKYINPYLQFIAIKIFQKASLHVQDIHQTFYLHLFKCCFDCCNIFIFVSMNVKIILKRDLYLLTFVQY